jgi:hypothetical protein
MSGVVAILHCAHMMYLKYFGKKLGFSSHKSNKRKTFVPIYVLEEFLELNPSNLVKFNPLDLYLLGYLKPSVYSVLIRNKETYHEHIFYACQTIRDLPPPEGPLTFCKNR